MKQDYQYVVNPILLHLKKLTSSDWLFSFQTE